MNKTKISVLAALVIAVVGVAACEPAGPAGSPTTVPGKNGAPAASTTNPAPGPQPDSEAPPSTVTPAGDELCFDPSSAVAGEALAGLGAAPYDGGQWTVTGWSKDPASAGCDGVLSWMTAEWEGMHPGVHILLFTGDRYLGTGSEQPYPYTTIVDKTRDTVTAEYRWPNDDDPLCCPQGGPVRTVFLLQGGTVSANGEFPPS